MKINCIFVNGKKYLFMKQIYLTIILWVSMASNSIAQLTVSTPHVVNNGQNGVTFSVVNNNAYNIRIFGINSAMFTASTTASSTIEVWFKNTAVKGPPGVINAANGWTSAGTFTINRLYTTVTPFISNLAINVTPGATFRIFVGSTQTLGYESLTAGAGINTFSNAGFDLLTGDSISYGGAAAAPPTFTPRGFVGDVVFFQLDTCSAKPTVGSITSLEGSGFCTGVNKLYYLTGFVPKHGITYQWQSSPTLTGTYTNVGTNTTMYTRTAAATAFIRCIASCGSLRDTTPVFRDTLNPFYLCYCQPTVATPPNSWGSIESVEFATTSTSNTANPCENYTDYRNLPIPKVRAGESLNIKMKNKHCSTNAQSAANGWLDLNRNGTFDAGESVPSGFTFGNAISTQLKSITVPLTNPLGITGLRFNLNAQGGFLPTNPCTLTNTGWAEIEDYLVEIVRDSNDIKLDSITGLADGCDLGNTNINFKATNIGFKAMNPVVVSYSVNGGTPVSENFASLAPGATAAYTFAAQANLAGNGTKVIRVWHANPLDTNKRNDTQTFTIISHPTPPNLVTIDDTVCIGSDYTTFIAPSNPPFMTRWYTDAAATNEVATGNSLVLANPTTTSIRYAKSVYSINGNVGPAVMAPSQIVWGPTGQGLIFNILRNKVRINSVKARFDQAGVAAIEIRNPANTVIQTTSFLVLTANTDVTVPLNIDLSIGTGYRMILNTSSGQAYAITGFTNFPQTIPGVISITGNTNTSTPPLYNYFFDWNVTYDACSSPVVPVNSVYLAGVNAPIKTLYKDTFFCQYPTIFLDANNAGSTYKWHDGSAGRTIQVTNTGTYKVTITNAQGCKSSDSARVQVRSSPIFKIGNDTTICSGKTLILKSGFSNEGYNHVWSSGALDPSIEVKSAGTYTVNVFNTNTQCGYNDTIIVNLSQSPNAFLGKDTFACNSAPITIAAPNPGTYTYMWDNGTSLATRTVSQSGLNKIWVDVTDISNPYGCKSTDTIIATIASLNKPNIGADVVTCANPQTIGVPADANLEYRWSNGGTTNNVNVTESNDYMLTVTQVNTTCSYMDTVKVTIRSNPPLDLGADIVTCKNDPITITANTGWTTYSWSNGFNVNKITIIPSSGVNTYTLTVTGPCGNKTVSKNITYSPDVPDVTLPEDMVVCEPTTLSITDPGSGYNMLWSTNETTTSITVDKTGTYWVSISNDCGSKTDAVRVIFDTIPTPEFIANWSGTFASFSNKSVNAVSYFWEFGDDSTSTDKHPTHRYKDPKEYTVKLTVKNSCDSSVTITKLIDLKKKPSGIQTLQKEAMIVYPNPANDFIVVKHSTAQNQKYTIELLTIDGRIVRSISNRFDANGEINVSVSDMAEGSYILRMIDKEGNQELKKLAIVR
jgi:hypothetical protein